MGRLKYAPTHRREPTQHRSGFRDKEKRFNTLKR
nr:MAG TPA: hypothetical protein [Caudoviricetes sp.]